jgi:circadian clock protein KaiB
MAVKAPARRKRAARAKPRPRGSKRFAFVLYISGATENSRAALLNIRTLVDKHLGGRCRLAVVDLYQDPRRAGKHDVVAVPMLVRTLPLPVRRMIGDLSDEGRVLIGLDLVPRRGGALGDRT